MGAEHLDRMAFKCLACAGREMLFLIHLIKTVPRTKNFFFLQSVRTCGKRSTESLRKSEHLVHEAARERKFWSFAWGRPRHIV